MSNDFLGGIERALGKGARVTSGYRTPEQQRQLVARGVTRATRSAHNSGTADQPGAVDIGGVAGGNPDQVRKSLEAAGYSVKKVIWETGQGANQGTGPHYHAEFGQGDHPVASSGGGMTQGESAQISGGNKFDIADPFNISPKVATQQQEVEKRGSALDNMLNGVTAELQAIQPQREANLQATVNTKRGINQEMQQQTRALIERATPLWNTRENIARRETELSQMNPVEKWFKGIFDPNYNERDLQGQDNVAARELGVLAERYDYISKLQTSLTNLVDQDYQNNDAVFQLHVQNQLQNVELLSKSFGVADQILGASMQGLENQMGLIRAQSAARMDILGQLSVDQAGSLYQQALNSQDGTAVVNGVPIGVGELKKVVDGYRDQDMALQSRELALQSGKLGLAQQIEDNLISHMSKAQITAAIQNGGVHAGQQLDVEKLTRAYAAVQNQDAMSAEQLVMQGNESTLNSAFGAISNTFKMTNQRMTQLLGQVPDEQRSIYMQAATEIKAISEGFHNAQAQGIGAQYVQQVYPRLQALQKLQQQTIDNVTKRWSGGDKNLKALGDAWITGQPISSHAAVQGIISMARNGVPAGMDMRGPAAETFKAVQARVRALDSAQPGDPINIMGKEQRGTYIHQEVEKILRSQYAGRLDQEIIKATPEIAKGVTRNGQPHPFAAIDPVQFLGAIQAAKAVAKRNTTKEMSPSEAAAIEQRALLDALDNIELGPQGIKASDAYVDLLNQPQYQNGALRIANGQVYAGGFPDYMMGTVGGGNIGGAISAYGKSMMLTNQQKHAAVLQQVTAQAQSMKGDPYTRARMILGAMDDMNRQDADTLLTAVKPIVAASSRQPSEVGRIMERDSARNSRLDKQFSTIGNVIMNHKFDDPALEAIRKRAASQWMANDSIIGRIMSIFD